MRKIVRSRVSGNHDYSDIDDKVFKRQTTDTHDSVSE